MNECMNVWFYGFKIKWQVRNNPDHAGLILEAASEDPEAGPQVQLFISAINQLTDLFLITYY